MICRSIALVADVIDRITEYIKTNSPHSGNKDRAVFTGNISKDIKYMKSGK